MRDKGLIFDIQRDCFADGPGIRSTVFFKGCNLRCRWCHNPESQDTEIHLVTDAERCTGCGVCKEACPTGGKDCVLCGRCARLCPSEARIIYGKWYTLEQVMAELLKDRDFYAQSGGGVTISGGECLLQPDFVERLLIALKSEGISTALDTAGCVEWPILQRMLPYTDLFLYDVKCIDPRRHREYTGRDNGLIIQNLRKLSTEFSGDIILRVPVVCGFNDDPAEICAIAALARECRVQSVELLPYHAMGKRKYRLLGREFEQFKAPDPEVMQGLRDLVKI